MKLALLSYLACPVCGGDLKFAALESYPRHGTEVEDGTMSCKDCARVYPITDGIPRLRPPQALESRTAKTRQTFGWEWLRYPGSLPEDKAIFLEETMLSAQELSGKLVLDAGCGMGRYSAIALSLGAEVIALDMSESLIRVAERARTEPKLHPVEGDLLHPPFKKSVFDVAYSQGVLHHTADTRAAFAAVAALIKPRGAFSVWLYGRAGRYAEFATNPIRPGREWIVRNRCTAWAIVLVRHIVSDILRLFTTRLPVPIVHAICHPLTWLGVVPGLKWLTYSVHPNYQVRLIENFDWISPPYQWHHTKEELSRWYQEEGFSVEKLLAHGLVPKPGALGRKKIQ